MHKTTLQKSFLSGFTALLLLSGAACTKTDPPDTTGSGTTANTSVTAIPSVSGLPDAAVTSLSEYTIVRPDNIKPAELKYFMAALDAMKNALSIDFAVASDYVDYYPVKDREIVFGKSTRDDLAANHTVLATGDDYEISACDERIFLHYSDPAGVAPGIAKLISLLNPEIPEDTGKSIILEAMIHRGIYDNIKLLSSGFQIQPNADTYVRDGGNYRNKNFGGETAIEVKQCVSPGNKDLNRKALIRFSIDMLSADRIANATLRVYSIAVQSDHNLPGVTLMASVHDSDWEETEITFADCKTDNPTVAKTRVNNNCWNVLDVTDAVKEAVMAGKTEITFMLSGLETEQMHMKFSSTESKDGNCPSLRIISDEEALTHPVLTPAAAVGVVKDVNAYAEGIVEEYLTWYKENVECKNPGEEYTRTWGSPSEYTLSSLASADEGANMVYTGYKSRSIESLANFDAASEPKHSEYGGRMDITLEATGFFRVEKIGDRWWLIDPEGHPYMAAGMGYVCPGTSEGQKAVTQQIHGSNEAWAADAADTLKNDLGFTAVTHLSTPELLNAADNKIPYSHSNTFLSSYAGSTGAAKPGFGHYTYNDNGTMPVFDPMFKVYSENLAKSMADRHKDDPYFLGYMSDNELPISTLMLDNSITLDPENGRSVYTYAVAHAWLRAMTGKESVSTADITDELRGKYCEFVYDWYFKVVTEAIRKYDQNHLYLGCRFMYPGYTHECFIRAAGRWCDVLTMNYYFVWEAEPETVKMWAEVSGRPFMITEFYLKGMDSGLPNTAGAGWSGKTQKDRADHYSSYVLKLIESGQCVGWSWLQYWDNDPNDPKTDSASNNANKGIYSSDFKMYTTLTDRMREVNGCMYALADYFDARQ